jgi:hypothetical protein
MLDHISAMTEVDAGFPTRLTTLLTAISSLYRESNRLHASITNIRIGRHLKTNLIRMVQFFDQPTALAMG